MNSNNGYCISLSKTEFICLLSICEVESVYGFDLGNNAFDKRTVSKALLSLATRELIESDGKSLRMNPDIYGMIENIREAQYVFAVENSNCYEKNCCLYYAKEGCTAIVQSKNGRLILSECDFEEWQNRLCEDNVPKRIEAANKDLVIYNEEDIYIDELFNIAVYDVKMNKQIESIFINDHITFGELIVGSKNMGLYSDLKLKKILMETVGEEYGIG